MTLPLFAKLCDAAVLWWNSALTGCWRTAIPAPPGLWWPENRCRQNHNGRRPLNSRWPAYVFDDPELYAEWKFVEQLQARMSQTDAIAVAVGAGVVNDLVKYVSHVLGRRYICVGTACSMDGFTAFGASITKDGNK